MEPVTCVLIKIDAKGQCQPFYLNYHDSRKVKGTPFQLDLALTLNSQDSSKSVRSSTAFGG